MSDHRAGPVGSLAGVLREQGSLHGLGKCSSPGRRFARKNEGNLRLNSLGTVCYAFQVLSKASELRVRSLARQAPLRLLFLKRRHGLGYLGAARPLVGETGSRHQNVFTPDL